MYIQYHSIYYYVFYFLIIPSFIVILIINNNNVFNFTNIFQHLLSSYCLILLLICTCLMCSIYFFKALLSYSSCMKCSINKVIILLLKDKVQAALTRSKCPCKSPKLRSKLEERLCLIFDSNHYNI